MKKNYFLILALIFTLNLCTQNISGKITYKVSMEPFSEKLIDSFSKKSKKIDPKMEKWARNVFKKTPDVKAYLEFSKGESIYKVEQKLQNEINNTLANKLIKSIAGGDNTYYVNLIQGKNQIQDCKLLGDCFIINMPSVKWNLTQKQKKIGKYNCFFAKATYKMYSSTLSLEAWYTLDIPVSFGPMNFTGLPGLIIELNTNKAWYKVTNIILNPRNKVVIKKPKKGKEVTSEEFESILKNTFPDFYKRIEAKRRENN